MFEEDDDLLGPVRAAFGTDTAVAEQPAEPPVVSIANRMADDIMAKKFPTRTGKPYDKTPEPNPNSVNKFINEHVAIGDLKSSYAEQYGQPFDETEWRRAITNRVKQHAIDRANKAAEDYQEPFIERNRQYIPFTAGIGLYKAAESYDSRKAVSEDRATMDDYHTLAREAKSSQEQQAHQAGAGVGQRLGEGIAALPATLADYSMGILPHLATHAAIGAAEGAMGTDSLMGGLQQGGQTALTDLAFGAIGHGFPGIASLQGAASKTVGEFAAGTAIGTAKGYAASQLAQEAGKQLGLNEKGGLASALYSGDKRAIEDNLIELGVFATAEGAAHAVKPLQQRMNERWKAGIDKKTAAKEAADALDDVEFRRSVFEAAGEKYPPEAPIAPVSPPLHSGRSTADSAARAILDGLDATERAHFEQAHERDYREYLRGGMSDADARAQVQRDFLNGVQAADEAVANTRKPSTRKPKPDVATPPNQTPDAGAGDTNQPDGVPGKAGLPVTVPEEEVAKYKEEHPGISDDDAEFLVQERERKLREAAAKGPQTIEETAALPARTEETPPAPPARDGAVDTVEETPKVIANDVPNDPPPTGRSGHEDLTHRLLKHLDEGGQVTPKVLFAHADEAYGGTRAEGKYGPSEAYDAYETALNLHLKGRTDPTVGAEAAKVEAKKLAELKDRGPTQTNRSGEKDKLQQFSTPPDYAYAATWLANIHPGETALEPSAGTGALAVHMMNAGAAVHANEYSARRTLLLGLLGTHGVTSENAEQLSNILGDKVKPSVVVMNPPFSSAGDRLGGKKIQAGPIHADQALQMLADGGRLVAILGNAKDRTTGEDTQAFARWMKGLKEKYNVKADVIVSGDDVYHKYGTDYDSRIVVIDKTGAHEGDTITGKVKSSSELIDLLKGVRDERTPPDITEQPPAQPEGREPAPQSRPEAESETPAQSEPGATLPEQPGGSAGQPTVDRPGQSTGQSRPDTGGGRPAGSTDATGGRSRPGGERPLGTQPTGDGGQAPRPGGPTISEGPRPGAGGADVDGEPTGQSGGAVVDQSTGINNPALVGSPDPKTPADVNVQTAAPRRAGELKDVLFDEYKSSVDIPGARPHPATLVEAAAMSGITGPPVTTKLKIAKSVIDSGDLSDAQLEGVARVVDINEQFLPAAPGTPKVRMGAMIGDGTGVGKGREIAGVVMHNWNSGRKKAVIVTKDDKLVKAAPAHYRAVGGNVKDVYTFQQLRDGKVPADGIVVMTYDTLKTGHMASEAVNRANVDEPLIRTDADKKDNLKTLAKWLGNKFEGAMIFDEAHLMGNALDGKQTGEQQKNASQRAIAGSDLQNMFPEARVSYYSGTAATEPKGLAYAKRLGLWGFGTPFASAAEFVNAIKGTGVAAMEIVARDLKAMGRYLARNISFNDGTPKGTVQFDRVSHKLDTYQRSAYEKLAAGWKLVDENISKWQAETGMSTQQRRAFNGQFKLRRQDFFNQTITAMMVPSLIKEIEADPKRSHVIQLTRTMDAEMQRAVKQATAEGTNLDDISISPRESLMSFIEKVFPTQQHEQYVDEEGKTRTRPVYDSQGNPVHNRAALAAKERFLKEIESTADLAPEGALDQLISHFGHDKVSEVTSRGKRRIWEEQLDGSMKAVIRPHGKSGAANDVVAFQDGRKRILVFSEGGNTGLDYHASLDAKNQDQRVHHLLQAGWRADSAMQGLGRTHRSNQASAPIYKLYEAGDLPGHKRFISTIAKRLASLGALSRGDRKAASVGMFKETDDLSTAQASAALQQLAGVGGHGGLDGVPKPIWDGLGLRDEPNMEQFLNSMLAEPPDVQKAIFDHFEMYHAEAVDNAIKNGTLDRGTQNFKAASIVKEHSEAIAKQTGGETQYVRFHVKQKQNPTPFENAAKIPEFMGFARQNRSGAIVAVRDWTPIDRNGYSTRRVYLVTPSGGGPMDATEYQEKYGAIHADQAKAVWDQQVAALPEFKESKLHMITGLMLPVFDRLADDIGDVRQLQTDSGERILGAAIAPGRIDELLSKFRRNTGPRLTETHAVDAIKQGATAIINNGWRVKESRVGSEKRIEIIGPSISHNQRIRQAGGFIERISGQDRYFLPSDGIGAAEALKLLTGNHAIRMAEAGGSAGGDSFGPDDTYNRIGHNPDVPFNKLAQELWHDDAGQIDPVKYATLGLSNQEQYHNAVEKLTKIKEGFSDGLKELAGQSTPRTAKHSEDAANKINEFVASKTYVHEATPYFINKVFGDAPAELRSLWGNALHELRGRFARFTHEQAGDQERADAIPSFIGADFPIKSEKEFRQIADSKEFKDMVAKWKEHFLPVQESNYHKATGLEDSEEIKSATQLPYLAFNMKALQEGEKDTPTSVRMGGGPGNLKNPRVGRLGFSKEATFGADRYEMDMAKIMENTLQKGTQLARKAEMYRSLVSEGLGKWGRSGSAVMIDGMPAREIPGTSPPRGTQAGAGKWNNSLYVDPRVYGEVRKALAVDEPATIPGVTPTAKLLTKIALLSTVEAAYHTKNNLTFLTKPGVNPIDFMRNIRGVLKGDAATQKSLLELASMNALKPTGAEWGGEGRSKWNPLGWTGKFLDVVDRAMRLTAKQAFERLERQGRVESGHRNMRDFVNQLGQYNRQTQHGAIRLLRDTGIGPFATAGSNYFMQGMRGMTLNPGVTATSNAHAIGLRAEYLARIAGALGAAAITNYLMWGRSDGDENTPTGGIKLGDNGKGRTSYLNLADVVSPVPRGARQIGAAALVQGLHDNKTGKDIRTRMSSDVVHGLIHPGIGPAPAAAYMLATGKNTLGQQVAKRNGERYSTPEENFTAFWHNLNPSLAAAMGWDQAEGQKDERSGRAMKFLNPYVKYRYRK